jgi:hypothetical protein
MIIPTSSDVISLRNKNPNHAILEQGAVLDFSQGNSNTLHRERAREGLVAILATRLSFASQSCSIW